MPISYDRRRNPARKTRKGITMTTAEYLATPETVLPRELAFGVLRVADSPVVNHQRVVRDLVVMLTPFVREAQMGELLPAPMDVVLDYDAALVVQPDVLFVRRDRQAIVADRVYGAPDLVIEVLSPHPRIGRLDERVGWFAQYGVRECWLVDLATRQIAVLEFQDAKIARRTLLSGADPLRSTVLGAVPVSAAILFGY